MKIGSLFSGYGGLDLGVQSVIGGEVVWHCEFGKAPSAILAHHYPNVKNFGDVKKIDWSNVEPVDVLSGGYPCQPFSISGNRKGTKDDRHMWPYFSNAISALRPRIIVLENVAGHLSLGLGNVLGDLSALGYDAVWGIIRASDAGACHQRARIFITAYTSGQRYGRQQNFRMVGRMGAAAEISDRQTRATREKFSDRNFTNDRGNSAPQFGNYADSIARWSKVIGRPAPEPTESESKGTPRLSAVFVEWMMGLPAGHVTDPAIGISRTAQIKMLGNGVVPQQAELALQTLLPMTVH